MARRRKIGDLTGSEAECYYCEAVIPASAMRCPSCGKFFSSAKKLIAFSVVLIVVVASLSGLIYVKFIGGHLGGGNGLGPGPEPSETNKFVHIVTSLGTIKIEMYEDTAPVTATHFINLVQAGEFNTGASFYRAERNFVVQGGLRQGSETTVPWEDNGLLNTAYTISMARSGHPDEAADSGTGSSEFFINLNHNTNLDKKTDTNPNGVEYPYVVFGRVVSGTEVVDQMSLLPTHNEGGIQILDNPIVFESTFISEN